MSEFRSLVSTAVKTKTPGSIRQDCGESLARKNKQTKNKTVPFQTKIAGTQMLFRSTLQRVLPECSKRRWFKSTF